ncbi:DedA family protein [Natronobiforma cellulositropha]|uniref:DedA family protein n=1 Tax=Natronobiforma cellulositropha TaxID=1679076 RepID=UPI0021D59D7B|nr:VTT domain-containing protein [Natronobiforma cellulositropha]
MLESFLEFSYGLLETVGLPVLFAIFVLKGSLIGKVFPTSVFLPGYVLAIRATYWEAALVVLVVTVAHVLGQLVVYAGCRRYGRPFVESNSYLDLETERFDRWFAQYGGVAIFATNVVPWTRGVIAIPAGVNSYPVGRYTTYISASTVLYHGAYVTLALAGIAVLV